MICIPAQRICAIVVLLAVACRVCVGQCGAADALSQVKRLGCLSAEGEAVLDSWLEAPEERARGAAAAVGAQAYECLLKKRVRAADLACVGLVLRERVLTETSGSEGCFRDRLTRSLLVMREIPRQPASGGPDMQALDGALGVFLGVYSAARAVAGNSTLAASVKLAASWCLDINAPLPAAVFAEEFADVAARIAAVFPEQGRHLGAVLAAVLRDARGPGRGGAAEGRLEESDRRLIEPDQQNIAGTSHFHIVRKRIEEIVPAPESANASEIAELVNATPELLREMETGVERMENRARAWRPFEEYSDILDQLAWRRGVEPDREAWRDSNRLACDLLQRGLELATGSEEAARLPLQVKLLDRVTRYGAELARLGRYRQVVEFESRFLEVPPHALTPDQECYIHAHLAQAYYALADYRRAMQHMAAANAGEHGELITAEDLRRLK